MNEVSSSSPPESDGDSIGSDGGGGSSSVVTGVTGVGDGGSSLLEGAEDELNSMHLDEFTPTAEDLAYEQTEAGDVAMAIAANRALREQLALAEGKGKQEANPLSWGEEQESVMRRVKVGRKPRLRPVKKVETNISRKMCRHETYEEVSE